MRSTLRPWRRAAGWVPMVKGLVMVGLMLAGPAVMGAARAADAPKAASATPDSPRLQALAAAIAAGDARAEPAFWTRLGREGTPLIETLPGREGRVLATFVVSQRDPGVASAAPQLAVFSWLPSMIGSGEGLPGMLQRLPGSDVWYRSYEVPANGRFPYFMARALPAQPAQDDQAPAPLFTRPHPAGGELGFFADPRNPQSLPYLQDITNGPLRGASSLMVGPQASHHPALARRKDVARGQVSRHTLPVGVLGDARQVGIYLPPGKQAPDASLPWLLLLDGEGYLQTVGVADLLDNLIADGALPPLVAIALDTVNPAKRAAELAPDSQLARFVSEELLPWARREWPISHDPAQAAVAGASLGGLASTHLATTHPEIFGNVLSQSGSYWWRPAGPVQVLAGSDIGWTYERYVDRAQAPRLPLRFYLEVGRWENPVMPLVNRRFRDLLNTQGYELCYRELEGGHDFSVWRESLGDGLVALLGTPQAKAALRARVCESG